MPEETIPHAEDNFYKNNSGKNKNEFKELSEEYQNLNTTGGKNVLMKPSKKVLEYVEVIVILSLEWRNRS